VPLAELEVPSKPCRRSVLACLGDHAWPDGTHAWPGIPRLASLTEYSERQVTRALAALLEEGLIYVEREATNRLPTMYALTVDNPGPGVTPRHPRGDTVSSGGDTVSPKPIGTQGAKSTRSASFDPVDECGCRYVAETREYDRCAEHGARLTAEERRRMMPKTRQSEGADDE
jgi:DNA-binding transcriptional ArsR family regulator